MTRRKSAEQFEPAGMIRARVSEGGVGLARLKRCARCLMTETNETMTFDERGVCNICSSAEIRNKSIDWGHREKDFQLHLADFRRKYQYDAIVPFSGGKDSAWTAYVLVRRYGLKILLATFDSNFRRPTHIENIERTVRALGCDHITFRASQDIIKRTMMESLKRKGDFCWYCHTGVATFPFRAALMYETPLLIWGEPNSEYAGYYGYKMRTEADERWFNRYINLSINAEDMYGYLGGDTSGIDPRDLDPFKFPDVGSLRKLGLRSIHLGDYIKWNAEEQVEILEREVGWRRSEVENLHPRYNYEKIECFLQGARDYLRFVKRGYSRTVQRANLDIRSGVMTREEANDIARYDAQRPASLDVLLPYLGLDEDTFTSIAKDHAIYPYSFSDSDVRPAQKTLDDQPLWRDRLLNESDN
jgi:N-acetyl sugar amidotransferase